MRQLRSISLTLQVTKFLQNYESQMLREGQPLDLVELIAFELYEILFQRLPRGSLTGNPQYVDRDPHMKGYSIYVFTEGYVTGVYSACGSNVVLHSLSIALPPIVELRSAVSAA